MTQFHEYRSIYSDDELMRRLRNIRHAALDMDGTIYMGMSLFPFTKPFLSSLHSMGITHSFLTNNPSKSIADYLHKLETLGIEASAEENVHDGAGDNRLHTRALPQCAQALPAGNAKHDFGV